MTAALVNEEMSNDVVEDMGNLTYLQGGKKRIKR